MKIIAFNIFLGAFLLFQVQPIIARAILPWFGGTPAVWTTAMLFFQAMLLLGYGYSHFIVSRMTARLQTYVQLGLIALSLVALPIIPSRDWVASPAAEPMGLILALLLVTVGAPYLMLSTTAPLMQAWSSTLSKGTPYRLYALSNLGSILGLLTYPLVVEPFVGLKMQAWMWSGAYVVFAATTALVGMQVLRHLPATQAAAPRTTDAPPVSLRQASLWVGLSMAGVVLLLAATNQLTRDVAVVPLLWLVPLTLFLLSFVISFGMPRLYHRGVWVPVMLIAFFNVLIPLFFYRLNLPTQIVIFSAVVFSGCMVCHGELYRLRPAVSRLTDFYLYVALGGTLGGVFVNLIAPQIFSGYWEFHLALLAITALAFLCIGTSARRRLWRFGAAGAALVCVIGLAVPLWKHMQNMQATSIITHRGFFGVLRIKFHRSTTERASRALYHGNIRHGLQMINDKLRAVPTTYYVETSGIGRTIRAMQQFYPAPMNGLRVGVVGLGTGTLAAYGRPADHYTFYEIDPHAIRFAENAFHFLSDSPAQTEVVLGDGRITIEQEIAQGRPLDHLIVVDAFSGDAIPVHLMTREAIAAYRARLTPDGAIALHISNLHFDLRATVLRLALDAGMTALTIRDPGDAIPEGSPSLWVILTENPDLIAALKPFENEFTEPTPPHQIWTDDFVNLLATLR